MDKWIKTKDKLPKQYESILFTDGKEVYRGFYSFYLGNDFTEEPTRTTYFGKNFMLYEINHWMPLPKPPTT